MWSGAIMVKAESTRARDSQAAENRTLELEILPTRAAFEPASPNCLVEAAPWASTSQTFAFSVDIGIDYASSSASEKETFLGRENCSQEKSH